MKIIIRKIKAAFSSRLEYKKELTDLQRVRLKICATCPFNSDNEEHKKLKDRIYILLNKILNFICGVKVTVNAICTKCGCGIIFKTTQTEEDLICPLKKWK